MRRAAGRVLPALVLMALAAASARGEKLQDLKPQGYVNDFAGVISAGAQAQLTALCGEVDQKAHAQIAIVTVHTLEGDSIEDFANRLYQQWGVGPKSDNRGVLILLAVGDHHYRTEVGYGLEPILPDGKVGGFWREVVPALRRNDYSGALLQVTDSIAAVIAQDRGVTLGARPALAHSESDNSGRNFAPAALFLIVIGFFIFAIIRSFISRGGGGSGRGGGWGGLGPWIIMGGLGGFGRGGFGGGGFGGGGGGGFGGFGGGMSGGGGASGSW
ncbi:MAG TPA: TPM domain-containing protein [Terriglobia bacterium]|nr:TPM domain-containing protein [Terriglobia bacterium]